ncbi:MAG: GGDEF domain-containing protein [Negativicutes bacterium]
MILLAIISIHAYYKLDRKETAHRYFFVLVLLTLVILILEILSVALNSGLDRRYLMVHKLVDTLGFTLAPLVPICAILYLYSRTNKTPKMDKKILWGLAAPLVANSLLSLGSYHYHWLFSITAENTYVRGPLFIISPLTSYFYYFLYLWVLYTNRAKFQREEFHIFGLLTLIPAVMSVFQLYFFIYLTIWNSMAIAVVINYIFIVHSQTKLDSLTGLGNRVTYNEYLANLQRKNHIVLSVVTIDLDHFKRINDKWGHQEGDKVLKIFAAQLKSVFDGKGVCVRLGGDEFVVLIYENQYEVVEAYIKELIDKVNDDNERMDLPCPIHFSYGMTIFNDTYQNLQELVRHSDRLMYQEKQKKQQKPHRNAIA